jgi:hypothetical protein
MQFRLAVLYASWLIDQQGEEECRQEIAALKIATPRIIHSIVTRAIQVHGGLGLTTELPLVKHLVTGMVLGLADGPTEVHQVNLARTVLKAYPAVEGLWPSEYRENVVAGLIEKYGGLIDQIPHVPTGLPAPAVKV